MGVQFNFEECDQECEVRGRGPAVESPLIYTQNYANTKNGKDAPNEQKTKNSFWFFPQHDASNFLNVTEASEHNQVFSLFHIEKTCALCPMQFHNHHFVRPHCERPVEEAAVGAGGRLPDGGGGAVAGAAGQSSRPIRSHPTPHRRRPLHPHRSSTVASGTKSCCCCGDALSQRLPETGYSTLLEILEKRETLSELDTESGLKKRTKSTRLKMTE